MKTILLVVLTAILVTSCTSPVPANPTKTINTNEPLAPSYSPFPSSTGTKTPLPSPPSSPILLTPSPWPTIQVIFTPDADQLARWQEYERALAKSHLSFLPPEEVLCEWEILEQSEQKVYVWAVCSGTFPVGNTGHRPMSSIPSVIHLGLNGAVQSAEIPGSGTAYARDIRNMFPVIAQERIFSRLINFSRLSGHLETRLNNPEPPLIVLDTTQVP